jgi:hypothetical protein
MLTVQGIAHKTHRKVTDKNVIDFVQSTNAYRKMFPQLLKVSREHFNSREHNRLLRLEKKLHRVQKRTGQGLGILAPDPDMEEK